MRPAVTALLIASLASAACGVGAAPGSFTSAGDATAPESTSPDRGPRPAALRVVEDLFTPSYRELTIPAGTTVTFELTSRVASAASQVEDTVTGVVRRPVTVDGITAIPAGAEIEGVVTDVRRSGRVKGRAQVAFRMTEIRAYDERYRIRTAGVARTAPATKSRDAAKIGIPAGAGAIVGGIADGKKGAAIGGAVGAGAGTGVVLATRGDEVVLGPGATFTTRLTEPLRVRVPLR